MVSAIDLQLPKRKKDEVLFLPILDIASVCVEPQEVQ